MAIVRTNYPIMSSLFDDFFGTGLADWRSQNYSSTNTTLPKANIKEDENGFVVEMAAPGMKKGDFKIQLDQNLLTISSEKQEEQKKRMARKRIALVTPDASLPTRRLPARSHCRKVLPETRSVLHMKTVFCASLFSKRK